MAWFWLELPCTEQKAKKEYNVRRPLKDLSSEEFVLGVEPVIEIFLSD